MNKEKHYFEQLLTRFARKDFLRGYEYFEAGNVIRIDKIGTDSISAKVSGKSDEPYHVDVFLDSAELPRYADCNCPNPVTLCKHVAATLLESYESGIIGGNFRPRQKAKNEVSVSEPQQQEQIIDLYEHSGNDHYDVGFLFYSQNPPLQVNTDTREKYRLIFLIQINFPAKDNEEPAYIYPAIQYIKKDGSGGRILKFSPGKLGEEPSSASKRLFTTLYDRNGSRGDRLSSYVDLLTKHPDIPLFLDTLYKAPPLPIAKLTSSTLHFALSSINSSKGITFKPVFTCYGRNSNMYNMQASDNVIIHTGWNGCYVLDYEASLLLLEPDPGKPHHQLSALYKRKYNYNYIEIRKLKSTLDRTFFNVIIPQDKVHIYPGEPNLRIYLDTDIIYGDFPDYSIIYEDIENPPDLEKEYIEWKRDNSEIHVFKRDKQKEYQLEEILDTILDNDDFMFWLEEHFYSITPEMLFYYIGPRLMEAGFDVRVKGIDGNPHYASSASLSVSSGIDWLDVKVVIPGIGTVNPKYIDTVRGIIRNYDSYIVLSPEIIQSLAPIVERAHIAESDAAHKEPALRISKGDLDLVDNLQKLVSNPEEAGYARMSQAVQNLRNAVNMEKSADSHFKPPAGLHGNLREYQKAGFQWLAFLAWYGFGGILADDMGLGKTIQALGLLQFLFEKDNASSKPFLVVAPVSTLFNWKKEAERFTPDIPVWIHHGQYRPDSEENYKNFAGIVLTSYGTLTRDTEILNKIEWQILIADEAQAVKNYKTKRFKALRSIHSLSTIILSGTPIENHIGELWALMELVNPGLLGSRTKFLSTYRTAVDKNNEEVTNKLKQRIRPFLLRRRKSEVVKELPPLEEIPLYLSMPQKQAGFYEALRSEQRSYVQSLMATNDYSKVAYKILASILRLRQAAVAPSIIGGPDESAKLEEIENRITELIEEGHKCLIFSSFVKVLSLVREICTRNNIQYAYIDGSTRKREKEVERFQEDPACQVFLVSIRAGGLGINLTAADYVFILDPWWNPAVEQQAVDRAHRIGQNKKVFAYRMVTTNTVEEKILSLQSKKRHIADTLIEGSGSIIKNLSSTEILSLFE